MHSCSPDRRQTAPTTARISRNPLAVTTAHSGAICSPRAIVDKSSSRPCDEAATEQAHFASI